MQHAITCPCGAVLSVNEAMEGQTIPCSCGRKHDVPPVWMLPVASGEESGGGTETVPPVKSSEGESPPRDFVQLFTPWEEVGERIDPSALLNLCNAIGVRLKEIESEHSAHAGLDVQVGMALFPGGQRAVEVQACPTHAAGPMAKAMERAIGEIDLPAVENGPVGFLVRKTLWGGMRDLREQTFVHPFVTKHPVNREMPYDEFFYRLVPVKHGKPPLWERARRGLREAVHGLIRRAIPNGFLVRWYPFRLLSHSQRRHVLDHWERELAPLSQEHLTNGIRNHPAHPKYAWVRSGRCLAEERFAEAILDCTRVLDRMGPDPAVLTRRAYANLMLGERAPALVDLNLALSLDARFRPALRIRGIVYLDLGASREAEADLRDVVAAEPRNLHHRRAWTQALCNLDCHDEALASLDQAAQLDPNSAEILFHRVSLLLSGGLKNGDYRELLGRALADCERAIRLQSESPAHWVHMATVQFRLGDLREAEASASRAIALDAECGPAYSVRGVCRQMLDRPAEGAEDCAKAIEREAAGPLTYIAKALAHAAEGDMSTALHEAITGLENAPGDTALLRCVGYLHLSNGEPAKAVELLTEAIATCPEWEVPYAERGSAYRALGDLDASIRDLDRAVELAPESAAARGERGLSRLAKGDLAEAEADFGDAIGLDKELSQAWMHRAVCRLMLGRPEEALEDLDEALQRTPENPEALFHRAQCKASLGDHDGAIADFDHLIRLCPTLSAAYSGRGSVWIQKGEVARGREDFQEAIARDPDSADAYTIRRLLVEASHAIGRNRYSQAVSRAGQVIEMDERCAPAYFLAGCAHWYAGEFVEAVDAYTKGLEIAGDGFGAYSSRGQVYAELGEYELALVDLDRAIELGQQSGESAAHIAYARSGRALALTGLGRHDDASRELEQSVRDFPQNAWVHFNQGIAYLALSQRREAAICFELALSLTEPSLPPRKKAKAQGFLDQLRKERQGDERSEDAASRDVRT